MNSVYESLRALLRNKELEIKKLEKEIEALRIVLPIVAEAGEISENGPTFEAPRGNPSDPKSKPLTASDFENVMAQVKPAQAPAVSQSPRQPATVSGDPAKARTTWP